MDQESLKSLKKQLQSNENEDKQSISDSLINKITEENGKFKIDLTGIRDDQFMILKYTLVNLKAAKDFG